MATIVVTEDNTTVVVGDGDTVIIDIPGGGTVTIVADPNDNVDKVKVEFVNDNEADTVRFDLSTFSEDDLHIDIKDYDPTDTVALVGAFDRYVDPDQVDEYTFSYIGADGNTYGGFVHAKDKGEKDFTANDPPIQICFAQGTIIDTVLGPRPVESLRIGDLVLTEDNGPQPVRWIGKRRLDSIDLTLHPDLCPVRVRPGALGDGLPFTDLYLSPQQRIALSDWRVDFLFGRPDALVAIKHLVNGTTITVERDAATVCYYHLLCDRHEIIRANGVRAESLHTGDMALTAIDDAARHEIDLIFPDLADSIRARETAHMVLKPHEAQAVLAYA